MKYTTEIIIDVPISIVVAYFDNMDNMKHWQEGFISAKHIAGEPGNPGAQTRLKYKMGKRKIEMIETITVRNLPKEFSATYVTKGVWNEIKNFFHEEDEKTRWVAQNEFRFSSFFMKIMGSLMPGAFKKQTIKYHKDFKAFAENKYQLEKA